MCDVSLFVFDKVVELFGGGSVINKEMNRRELLADKIRQIGQNLIVKQQNAVLTLFLNIDASFETGV